jgi:hypothetical protein
VPRTSCKRPPRSQTFAVASAASAASGRQVGIVSVATPGSDSASNIYAADSKTTFQGSWYARALYQELALLYARRAFRQTSCEAKKQTRAKTPSRHNSKGELIRLVTALTGTLETKSIGKAIT